MFHVIEQLPYELVAVKDKATDRIADGAQKPAGMVCEALYVPLGNSGRKEARTKKTPSESLGRVVARRLLRIPYKVGQLAEESLSGGNISIGDQRPKTLDGVQAVP